MSIATTTWTKLKNRQLLNRNVKQILGIWLVLRLLTLLWAAVVSPLYRGDSAGDVILLWPPSVSVGAWLERVFLIPWLRWDVTYYVDIVSQGYRLDDGTAQFHPLLPWLAKPLYWLTNQPLLALLVVSSLATIALLIAFERLARLDLPPKAARTSLILFLFSPPAFILFAPYTESLFLLCSVLCFFYARKQWWWLAGLAGGLATLTRQQGIFLMLPLAWELWEAAERDPRQALAAWRNWFWLALVPFGLVIWITFRAVALQDLEADFTSLQTLLYTTVISSSSSKVVPLQAFLWPWQALGFAFTKLWTDFEISLLIDLVLGGVFIALFVIAWNPLRWSYRIYSLAAVLISFAYHTGPFYPYMGLPRHLLLAFPVFIGLGAVWRYRWQRLSVVGLGLLGICFLLLLYVLEGWVP